MASDDKKNTNNTFKYIICFIIFLVIGIAIGIFGTSKFIDLDDEEVDVPDVEVKDIEEDITYKHDYQKTIESLYSIIDGNIEFYSSAGVDKDSLSTDVKLRMIYDYIIDNKKYTENTIESIYYGSTVCQNNFILDAGGDVYNPSTICSVNYISKTDIQDVYNKYFGNTSIEMSSNFSPRNNRLCVALENEYICGNVADNSGITGSLESKFKMTKVTKNKDGDIMIFEKGYLVDTRSNIVNPDDGNDNYYLHSSDSNEYYYELKSADNLTFKHTFKVDSDNNYYYVSTEVVK